MKKNLNKNKIIFSDFILNELKGNPLTLIDAGARGDLEEPWLSINEKMLEVIGFEPDKKECSRLNNLYTNRKYFPFALWSENKKIEINVTDNPFCSSVYEPNMDTIKIYEKKHWENRGIKEKIIYEAKTLDSILAEKETSPDFIKIDTQGAEYEILKGSKETLGKTFAVLTETWVTEVYKNAPFTEDIIKIMRENGFTLFDTNVAAAWKRTESGLLKNGKRQIIGLDLLFFKDINQNNTYNDFTKLLKAISIAEVYGFPDYALALLSAHEHKFSDKKDTISKIKENIVINSNQEQGLIYKILRKIKRQVFGINLLEYPNLHS